MLEIKNIEVGYGDAVILRDVSLTVQARDVVTVLGANGVGKTTLNLALSGILPLRAGEIRFDGNVLNGKSPQEIVNLGLIHVPEGRKVFPNLTVRENLEMGCYRRARKNIAKNLAHVMEIFPKLKDRRFQTAGTLSGGEQQMLAIARGLMAEPRMLILDEPSLGLSPLLVEELFNLIRRLHAEGLTIVLVEQNVMQSLEIADYGYVLEQGKVVLHGRAKELLDDDSLKRAYLGM